MNATIILANEHDPFYMAIHSRLAGHADIALHEKDFSFRDPESLRLICEKSDYHVLINAAAFNNIDESEYRREEAYQINAIALKSLAGICRNKKIVLTHLSTSSVFDGAGKVPFTEDDDPAPISAFGDSKLLGEKYIQETTEQYLIVRIPDCYGPGFDVFRLPFILRGADNSIAVLKDHVVSPAYFTDMADCLMTLIGSNARGIFNIAQDGFTSASGFINEALSLMNLHGEKQLTAAVHEIDVLDASLPAERPRFNVLDISKYKSFTGKTVRNWRDALDDYIAINLDTIHL